jgi:hypothetical protein
MRTTIQAIMGAVLISLLSGCHMLKHQTPPPAITHPVVTMKTEPTIPVTLDTTTGHYVVVPDTPADSDVAPEPKTIVKKVTVVERVLVPTPPVVITVPTKSLPPGCSQYVAPSPLPMPPDPRVHNNVLLDADHLNALLIVEVDQLKKYISDMRTLDANAYSNYLHQCKPTSAPALPALPSASPAQATSVPL